MNVLSTDDTHHNLKKNTTGTSWLRSFKVHHILNFKHDIVWPKVEGAYVFRDKQDSDTETVRCTVNVFMVAMLYEQRCSSEDFHHLAFQLKKKKCI